MKISALLLATTFLLHAGPAAATMPVTCQMLKLKAAVEAYEQKWNKFGLVNIDRVSFGRDTKKRDFVQFNMAEQQRRVYFKALPADHPSHMSSGCPPYDFDELN
jgi:hypothetical protein